jgi:hypothetical protein
MDSREDSVVAQPASDMMSTPMMMIRLSIQPSNEIF